MRSSAPKLKAAARAQSPATGPGPADEATEYRRISARTKELLTRQEGLDVEFKESLAGLEAEDLVAFANSKAGGAILIGVKEEKGLHGRQVPRIVGSKIGDREKVTILSKAQSCRPPVPVRVVVENLDTKPLFRIEIPTGPNKPYCTSGGTYSIRGDGRREPLLAEHLLALFVERENEVFVKRFQEAAQSLEGMLEGMSRDIEVRLHELQGSASDAEHAADSAMTDADESKMMIHQVHDQGEKAEEELMHIGRGIELLLRNAELDSPRDRHYVLLATQTKLRRKPRISQRRLLRELQEQFSEISKEKILEWSGEILAGRRQQREMRAAAAGQPRRRALPERPRATRSSRIARTSPGSRGPRKDGSGESG